MRKVSCALFLTAISQYALATDSYSPSNLARQIDPIFVNTVVNQRVEKFNITLKGRYLNNGSIQEDDTVGGIDFSNSTDNLNALSEALYASPEGVTAIYLPQYTWFDSGTTGTFLVNSPYTKGTKILNGTTSGIGASSKQNMHVSPREYTSFQWKFEISAYDIDAKKSRNWSKTAETDPKKDNQVIKDNEWSGSDFNFWNPMNWGFNKSMYAYQPILFVFGGISGNGSASISIIPLNPLLTKSCEADDPSAMAQDPNKKCKVNIFPYTKWDDIKRDSQTNHQFSYLQLDQK